MIGRLYLTMDTLPDGRVVAIVSDGSPQFGDQRVIVCTVKTYKLPMEAAKPLAQAWFEQMCAERPWETRQ